MKTKTQKEMILEILKDRKYHPVSEFLQAHIPRYGARLFDLREEGYIFAKRSVLRKPKYKFKFFGSWIERKRVPQEEWRLLKKPTN